MSYPDAPQPAVPVPHTSAKLLAEGAGTFLLVFGLIGTATFSAFFGIEPSNPLGVGFLGVALALGFSVMIGAFAFGPVSGGHFNPAVTLGLAAAGRFSWREAPGYIAAQFVGAIAGAAAVLAIASGGPLGFLDRTLIDGFGSNGFAELSPNVFSLFSVVVAEVIATAVFLFVILGVTHSRAAHGFAPLAIGLTLTVMLLVMIPVDNGSLNPARSLATALFAGGPWLLQVWVFLVFPSLGALIAGFVFATLFDRQKRGGADVAGSPSPVSSPAPRRASASDSSDSSTAESASSSSSASASASAWSSDPASESGSEPGSAPRATATSRTVAPPALRSPAVPRSTSSPRTPSAPRSPATAAPGTPVAPRTAASAPRTAAARATSPGSTGTAASPTAPAAPTSPAPTASHAAPAATPTSPTAPSAPSAPSTPAAAAPAAAAQPSLTKPPASTSGTIHPGTAYGTPPASPTNR